MTTAYLHSFTTTPKDEVLGVRDCICSALNPDTPPLLLSALAHLTDDPLVLQGVALNPVTPAELLEWVVWRGDAETRYAVATSEKASPQALLHLADTEDVGVLGAVMSNPGTTEEVADYIQAFYGDRFDADRSDALTHPDQVRLLLEANRTTMRARLMHQCMHTA